jgi:hypothetical protein
MADINAIQDKNQQYSLLAATGTAGTAEAIRLVADADGRLGVNVNGTVPVTGSFAIGTIDSITNVAGGTVKISGTTPVSGTVAIGAINSIGTVGVVNDGTVAIKGTVPVSGALSIGTISEITNIVAGTLNTAGTVTGVGVVGNLNAGTITSVASVTNLAGGTIGIITAGTITPSTTVRTISAGTLVVGNGTIASVGTVPGVGVVASVTNVASGTLAAITSVTNLVSGTLAAVTSVTNVVNGTLSIVKDGTVAVKAGTIASVGTIPGVGVVASVTNLAGGTVGILSAGSVVVTNGTVTLKNAPVTQVLTAQALATGTASTWGTLSAASGAGTSHYVSGLQIVVSSGTVDCYVGFGTATTGGSVLARGNFVPSAGIMRDFTFPIQSGTNSEICWNLGGAGTASIAVNYWKL